MIRTTYNSVLQKRQVIFHAKSNSTLWSESITLFCLSNYTKKPIFRLTDSVRKKNTRLMSITWGFLAENFDKKRLSKIRLIGF